MRRHGSVRCAAARLDEPGLAGYDDYVGRSFELASLRSYRWLAMRRGERERLLALALEPGSAALLDQVRLRKGRLGKAALGRSDESLLEELVGNDLEAAIVSDLDSWARIEALRSAANAYAGLLGTRPLRVSRLASVFLGDPGQPVGVAVLDGEGALVDWLELDAAEHGWLDRAADLVRTSEVRHVAVPSDTRSSKRLSSLEEKMGHGMAFVPVRPVALTEGRGALPEAQRTLPRTVQNAAVLAQRAMSPLEAWGGIDPVRAGVGEYQGELDEAELREILEAARAEVARAAARAPAPPLVVAPAPKALGTLVRTVAELRQGMMVSGTISNITGFGAFVSLGLEYEGMIHVSELSDRFVSDPTEVVQIGQKVTARVVEVDASRRRIALSLRSENERRPARTGAGKRSQVLRDLDKLFKKP
jgi:transcriptional accessory protein Tex/SPT6